MRKQIRRLRLREGDIIVVRDELTLEALMSAAKGMKNIPDCPIVIAPESIHRLDKSFLRKLLAEAN
jgi:hypothetical protein